MYYPRSRRMKIKMKMKMIIKMTIKMMSASGKVKGRL